MFSRVAEISREKKDQNNEMEKESQLLIRQVGALKYELQHDKPIELLKSEEFKDYNSEIQRLGKDGNTFTYMQASFLFVGCYIFARIKEIFDGFPCFKDYDPFAKEKNEAFSSSAEHVQELIVHLKSVLEIMNGQQTEEKVLDKKQVFEEMLYISLWGNTADLGFMNKETVGLQGKHVRDKLKHNILSV